MYCRNCGAQLPDNSRICSKCGHEIKSAVASTEQAKSPTFSKGSIIFITLSLSFLAVIIIWASLYNDNTAVDTKSSKETTTSSTTKNSKETTTSSTTKPSTTTDESTSGNVTESSDDTDNNKEPYEYRETMSVLNAIKSNHSEFNYYDVTEEGKFKFKISDIEYSAGGMNRGTDEWIYGDGYVVGCSILLDYNKEMIDNAGGIDKLNDKIIDEVLYLIYSPYLSEYKSMGIKDVIASKMKYAVKNKMHMYNDPDNFIGTGVQYGDYIYCVVCSEDENGDAEIWKIDIVPYEEYIGPGLVKFHGDVVTDDDIGLSRCGDDTYEFFIDKSRWADATSANPGYDKVFSYTSDSSINAFFGVTIYKGEVPDYSDLIDEMKNGGFIIESEEDSTLGNGYSAYRVKCSYQNYEYIQYFSTYFDQVYHVICTSDTDSFSAIEPEFEEILSTFRFGYRQ